MKSKYSKVINKLFQLHCRGRYHTEYNKIDDKVVGVTLTFLVNQFDPWNRKVPLVYSTDIKEIKHIMRVEEDSSLMYIPGPMLLDTLEDAGIEYEAVFEIEELSTNDEVDYDWYGTVAVYIPGSFAKFMYYDLNKILHKYDKARKNRIKEMYKKIFK